MAFHTFAQDGQWLIVVGARQNNLRNITVRLPHNAVTVITGVSGSGKSSLAFDTIFAEGQWRYMESLSPYARMFIERLDRPDVDRLLHIRPALAIEQRNPVRTARSTVGTTTELADYLRVLFAKIGRPFCPDCHQELHAFTPDAAARDILHRFPGARVMVLFPISCGPQTEDWSAMQGALRRQGFVRLLLGDRLVSVDELKPESAADLSSLCVVLDRMVCSPENRSRLVEAIETAYRHGEGRCRVDIVAAGPDRPSRWYCADRRCLACGKTVGPLRPTLFSFNHPLGACPDCQGFGNRLHYDEQLVIPDPTKSLVSGAIEPWTKPAARWWQDQLVRALTRRKVDVTTPYAQLPADVRRLIWKGGPGVYGIEDFFQTLEEKRYKLHVRVFLSRYRSPRVCPTCQGTRLTALARSVKIQGMSIDQVSSLSIQQLYDWVRALRLSPHENAIAGELRTRLLHKLDILLRVGVEYLTVSRETRTLSGGETQRLALANQLSASLTGTLYVLDEPTIGLHPRDTARLMEVIELLAERGNTLVVVEHDRTVIEQAHYVIEMGPGAGEQGGRVVFAAPRAEFLKQAETLTARYLRGEEQIPLPSSRRQGTGRVLTLEGASAQNLKDLTVQFPLGMFICVTGVSGAGKSTLVNQTLYPAVAWALGAGRLRPSGLRAVHGAQEVRAVRLVDQAPIGRTPRSNPLTYLNGYQPLRRFFASLPAARARHLTPAHFSFNAGSGRCSRCQGTGFEKLDMYFFEDLYITCEACQGQRFRPEVLEIRFRGLSIAQVLQLTVDEAHTLLAQEIPGLQPIFQLLRDLGLGYLKLGQPATSLSGGEAQRLKLAAEFLAEQEVYQGKTSRTLEASPSTSRGVLYILDEPTTGLHLADVKSLLSVVNRLVDAGHTVVVVEHQLDVIKCADWLIDLGPVGGEQGGYLVAQGRPEEVVRVPHSVTGRYLRPLVQPCSGKGRPARSNGRRGRSPSPAPSAQTVFPSSPTRHFGE
ncbi:MAG: excinuclease ABC subunit A [Nitrospirae bacterium]|nr:MAG: excinuclease ABC subunit A [Nitrospirota bacterium]